MPRNFRLTHTKRKRSVGFYGPSIIKKNMLYNLPTTKSKPAGILRASLDFNGTHYILHQNSFSIDFMGNDRSKIRIWHSYNYFQDTSAAFGRWYDTFPIDYIRTMTDTNFIYKMTNYEHDNINADAEIRIEFTKEALDEIHEMAYS